MPDATLVTLGDQRGAYDSKGWKVSVSVVTKQASFAYADLPLENLWVGPLDGSLGIRKVLYEAESCSKGFKWVVDATHPFAKVISRDLLDVCKESQQPLLRFERILETSSSSIIIKNVSELATQSLVGRRLLLALGRNHLKEAVRAAKESGANVFARVLPNPESIIEASSSGLRDAQIAVLRPLQGDFCGDFEIALCRRWSITDVVCRQSAGPTQELWQSICRENDLRLFLIARPSELRNFEKVDSIRELVRRVAENF